MASLKLTVFLPTLLAMVQIALGSIEAEVKASKVEKKNKGIKESKEIIRIKDYGVHGHVFPIIEQSLFEVIAEKLAKASKDGKLQAMQQQFKERAISKIMRPSTILGLKRASQNRSWTYNPSITQIEPITDHHGKIIVAAGTKVNPLDSISWGQSLILIDGDDQQQIDWAISQKGKIVLTNGSPIELSEKLARPIYFDQGGLLTERFNIEAIPAIICQEGKLLKIREVYITKK